MVRNQQYTVVARDGHLDADIPEGRVVNLEAADEEGKWFFRLNPTVSISFQESEDGQVLSFTSHSPEGDLERPRVEE